MFSARVLRYSVRRLVATPGFTIAAIVTLSLGVGASTAIFTIVNGLLLRPLPYRNSGELVVVTARDRAREDSAPCLSYPRYALIAASNTVFSRIAGFVSDSVNVTAPGQAEQVRAARVSPTFFDVLGIKPSVGRGFIAADETAASGAAVIISDGLWRTRFGANPNVAGKAITLDGTSRVVVGVLPPNFTFAPLGTRIDVWTPRIDELSLAAPEQLRNGTCYLTAVARLAPGVGEVRAQAQMGVLNGRYLREYSKLPDADPHRQLIAESLQETVVGKFKPLMAILTASVLVVLLIACANAAGLLLARGLARRRELAVREALGATRSALVGELLSESLLVALAGGAIGLVASVVAITPLSLAAQTSMPRSEEIAAHLDPRVVLFAIALSIITGVVAGLVPGLSVSHKLPAVLRSDGRGSIGDRRRAWLRSLLVGSQVALSLVLIVAAGLLLRSFWKLQMIEPGFDPRGTLTMNLSLPSAKYASRVQMIDFYERLLSKVQSLPGVEGACLASALPLNPSRMTPILAEGQPVLPLAERPVVVIQTFLGSYLATLRVPLVKGRVFDGRDTRDAPPVVVVNQAFARKFFGKQDPVGRHVVLGRRDKPAEIVGVIGDVKNESLTADAAPEIDVPFAQLPWPSMNLTIRSASDSGRAVGPVRAAIASLDRDVPLTRIQTLEEVLAAARFQPKVLSSLLGLFAVGSLVLASVGLYGLIAYSAGQRRQEFGVRMALGATRSDITALVLRQGLLVTGVGIVVGLGGSFAVTRWMASMLYEVGTADPLIFALCPLLFLVVAAVASWLPAHGASGVDPCEALRTP